MFPKLHIGLLSGLKSSDKFAHNIESERKKIRALILHTIGLIKAYEKQSRVDTGASFTGEWKLNYVDPL